MQCSLFHRDAQGGPIPIQISLRILHLLVISTIATFNYLNYYLLV